MIVSLVLASLLLSDPLPASKPASCEVISDSRSSSGVPQVSNLDLIRLEAKVPARQVPASGVLEGLRAEAVVYQVLPGGKRSVVPSVVRNSGGGLDSGSEFVTFWLDIPIDPEERDAAIEKYVTSVLSTDAGAPAPAMVQAASQAFAETFRQHRAGTFQVECIVRDQAQAQILGSGSVELEVLFKGQFFDQEAFRQP